jgi:O-methyltransferase involved in polyketide biosynthesis
MGKYAAIRTNWFDDTIRSELNKGDINAVIFFGSGFATQSQRFAPLYSNVAFIEIDFPHILQRKQEITTRIHRDSPNIVYKFVNLTDSEETIKYLKSIKGKPNQRQIVAMEGFIYYMLPEVAKDILQNLNQLNNGSIVVMDYIIDCITEGTCVDTFLQSAMVASVRNRGEPWLTGFPRQRDSLQLYMDKFALQTLAHQAIDEHGGIFCLVTLSTK